MQFQADKFTHLTNQLTHVPDHKFDMGGFFMQRAPYSHPHGPGALRQSWAKKQVTDPECGSCGCVVGYLPVWYPGVFEYVPVNQYQPICKGEASTFEPGIAVRCKGSVGVSIISEVAGWLGVTGKEARDLFFSEHALARCKSEQIIYMRDFYETKLAEQASAAE